MKKILAGIVTALFLFVSVVLSAVIEMIPLGYKYAILGAVVVGFYIVVLKTLDEDEATREKDGVYND
jgi:multidrug transporter EmrE-like cation transporter